MNPQLDDFLEDAFASVKPTSAKIGRVVVEPDYNLSPGSDADAAAISEELRSCLAAQSLSDDALASREGLEVSIEDRFGLLKKYLLRITLHGDAVEEPWVEVAPPGSWI